MFSALKIHVAGWRQGIGQQADRIEEGFRAEGCEVVADPRTADLCYANDSGYYQQIIDAKVRGGLRPNAKVIFNVLDLAPHLGAAFPLARIRDQLVHADAITTISQTVRRDIKSRLGVEATVVYNPIRDVFHARPLASKHTCCALFVGRVNDPWKRCGLGAAALSILGLGWDDMVTVGREPPHYGGAYAGEVADEVLNTLYNSADFVMFPSSINEGLGLPIIESMACGAIPVVCNDLCTRQEFLPSSVFPEYDSVGASAPEIARFVARFMGEDGAERKAAFSARLYQHYISHLTDKLSPRGVANAILRVYQSIADVKP